MTLKPAEFEEAEYRGPLFNQLQTGHLLWEPGQVFEEHIGIDHALWTIHAYFHSLHGYSAPLAGVTLSRYKWDYIWLARKRKKKLPSFRLNVFVQAKRPMYGRYAPKLLKQKGLSSPFWRFEVTPHQQLALERLASKLGDRAIVCYACPAFHKEAILHKWTVTPRMVEESTFPDVRLLKGHAAWNYSAPGAAGVANADPEAGDSGPLLDRIKDLVERNQGRDSSPAEELSQLAGVVRQAQGPDEAAQATAYQAAFADHLLVLQRIAEDFSDGDDQQAALLDYGTVLAFAHVNRLNWLVAGWAQG